MKTNDLVKDLHYDIGEAAKKLGVPPSELTLSQFHAETSGKYSSYALKKIGGFKSFLNTHFTHPDKDLKTIYENKTQRTYIKALEDKVGKLEATREEFQTALADKLAKVHVSPITLNPKETKKYFDSLQDKGSERHKRSVVTLWSDHHYGERVSLTEMHGKNSYNPLIAARRLGMLCEQTATFKPTTRSEHEELVILMMGDMIHGIIHDWERHDDLKDQMAMFFSYMVDALTYLKGFYPKIRVICQPGNHERMMHKTSKDRAVSNRADSYANVVYDSLQKVFKGSNVSFEISKAPFADVMIQGHRIYATHGDTVLKMGNPGTTINTGLITKQINAINVAEAMKGMPVYELFCSGHLHEYMEKRIGKVKVIVNGCLVGLDEYAHSIGIQEGLPVQLIWETTKGFVTGDRREIEVSRADDEPRFEKIIKPYVA